MPPVRPAPGVSEVYMKKETIRITGPIDSEAYAAFTDTYDDIRSRSMKIPIHVIVNSEGGCATDAIAISEIISKDILPVSVHGTGLIASAATLILVSGALGLRSMDASAWVLIHEEFDKLKGRVSQLEAQVSNLRKLERQWDELFEHYTEIPTLAWHKMHIDESYLSSKECLARNMIDFIVPLAKRVKNGK